ncbi:vanadium-dependent haloperoxidase [Archangium violaceum]|uniref:vanadium-dependent haloperoxidase n=1 Tax=Archangium violaceum TaxID=83451 RepID=UPI00193B6ADA|nr:vanadium-dependent haloperoxidase [Archangium violaceum]QRK07497.1 vanadium-dependent haloperoxidase [Archangium violaceum]
MTSVLHKAARGPDRNHSSRHHGALATVLLAALVVSWPAAVSAANPVLDWHPLVLKLEPMPRFTPHTRAAALVYVSIHDALNSIPGSRRYATYLPPVSAPLGASPEAAATAAAHWALHRYTATVHPENTHLLLEIDAFYASSLAAIPDGPSKYAGIAVGEAAAEQLWMARANDGWDNPNQLQFVFPEPAPGVWRPVPPWAPDHLPPFYWWNSVTPWTLTRASQFLSKPPPNITSSQFLEDVAETRAYGAQQSTVRTEDQSHAARWWGACEDSNFGSPGLIARQLLTDYCVNLHDSARIFALLALAQADAIISNIDSKNTWNFWRPITAIHEGGNADWTPFLTTPPNQEYPAGHPMVSGSGIHVLAKFFPGQLPKPLRVTSEYCGPRTFLSLSDAVQEVIGARVWGGMHFRDSGVEGAALGEYIAHWVHGNYLLPLGNEQ